MNGYASSMRAPRGSNYSSNVTSPNLSGGYAGSKSSGQPSPGSFIDELRYKISNSEPQAPGRRPVLRNPDYVVCNPTAPPTATAPTPLSYQPHHKSEMSLSTTGGGCSVNFHLSQGYRDRPQPIQRQISTSSSTAKLANVEMVVRPPAALDSSNPAMRGGPSFRRLQSLYGNSTSTQKRYPSDNTLDKIYPTERAQTQYTAPSRKAGTVKIQVRSRSAQASPSASPAHSPRQVFQSSGHGYSDDRVRSQRTIVPTAMNRTQSSPPKANRARPASSNADDIRVDDDDEDSETLPSVREIIRQVEEMTQKNCNSSSLPRQPADHVGNSQSSSHKSRASGRTTIQYEQQDSSFQRRSSSQSASNAMNECQYPPMNAHHDDYDNPIVPNPPNSSFHPRRTDNTLEQDSRLVTSNATPFGARKTDLLSNLPLDYQKLREAFLEQRREIQRLRKELAEKTRLIADLQRDIRLYEPWR